MAIVDLVGIDHAVSRAIPVDHVDIARGKVGELLLGSAFEQIGVDRHVGTIVGHL